MWFGGPNGSKRERLHRFLVIEEWDCLGGGLF